eukprot:3593207-Pyramimonas_sp.AAC.2
MLELRKIPSGLSPAWSRLTHPRSLLPSRRTPCGKNNSALRTPPSLRACPSKINRGVRRTSLYSPPSPLTYRRVAQDHDAGQKRAARPKPIVCDARLSDQLCTTQD